MTCERCWNEAYLRSLADTSKTQSDHYQDLLVERGGTCLGPRSKWVGEPASLEEVEAELGPLPPPEQGS